MRVHAKVKVNGTVNDYYFINPMEVLTHKTHSLEEAFDIAEASLRKGYYCVPAISYESNKVLGNDDAPFMIGIFSTQSNRESFQKEAESYTLTPLQFVEDRAAIEDNVEKIRDFIRDGHTYQVNYTARLSGKLSGDGHTLFLQLMHQNNGDYAFYIEHEDEKIISCSPELFFERDGQTIRTKPMKGTSKRYQDPARDKASYEFLKHSKKDRAENVMIVDLLRNDLSKIATRGSVRCPELFTIETYATVYQMTSTVEAELKPDITLNTIMDGLFPCGSITGAPKLSTMKIIDALESTPRQYYCGTIGLMLSPDAWVFNVPIRTMYIQGEHAVYGAGAGITYDSNPSYEYEEFVAKTSFLKHGYVSLIESMRVERQEIKRFDLHLKRLVNSASTFDYPIHKRAAQAQIESYVTAHLDNAVYKLRALLSSDGTIELTHESITPEKEMVSAIHHQPIRAASRFLSHKTTVRHHYQLIDELALNLYYNRNNELTEFNIGNLVIKEAGRFYTPPIEVGLLNGVMRQELLAMGKVSARIYLLDEFLNKYKRGILEVYMINSVREWTLVKFEI